MTDPSHSGRHSPRLASRRQRAPTITIDTSAVSPPPGEEGSLPLQALSDRPQASHDEQRGEREEQNNIRSVPGGSSPVELRAAHSFESRDSRPTSPHNVSSPTFAKLSEIRPDNFLAVPNAGRSRVNSIDSEIDIAHSPTSYSENSNTYVESASQDDETRTHTDHSNLTLIKDKTALDPDLGKEPDFVVKDNRFAFSPGQLNKLLAPKSLAAFYALGGLRGLEKGLRTDIINGLSLDETSLEGYVSFEDASKIRDNEEESPGAPNAKVTKTTTRGTNRQLSADSFTDRKRIYGDNKLPEKKAKTIFELAWLAYNDKVLILLTVAAIVSLALGIYQAVGKVGDPPYVQWVEGVAITVAIAIVVVVGAANDWQKERQFVKLNKKKEDRLVKVVRSGMSREISVYDVLVGDVMHLEPGDVIPVDGIYIGGHSLTCDEASATGESDLLKKTPGNIVFKAIDGNGSLAKLDPFITSGGKVTEGVGTFLVTSVGVNSFYGKILMSLREESQTTPLQSKLNILAEYIAKLGLAAGLLLFVVTFIEFLARLHLISGGAAAKGQAFLNVFIVAVTIVVVAVPEGLPLAVTLALAFATTQMLKDNNLVRQLRACETMGNATTVCSDKTGTLTQNKMTVVAGTISTASRFGDKAGASKLTPQNDAGDVSITEFIETLSPQVKEILKQSIVINTTAFEGYVEGKETFIGSKTETSLLSFASDHLGMGSLTEERSAVKVVQLVPFDSGRKCMATAVKMANGKYRLYVKGASELMLAKCTRLIRDPSKDLWEISLTADHLETLTGVIDHYASRSLRTIGLLYKDFEQWPPRGAGGSENSANFDKVLKDMVFLGIVGIQDPLREGVADAVRDCQNAGVFVRMVTGDNLLTAKAIATECGIYTEGGVIMEGPTFRRLSKAEMNHVIPHLQVLARSSPDDKRILVKRLKDLGETVAVTGDGTNDAPALKTADVGFSMGISGTEVAKEASDIILMDDNFSSIVKAIMWGRAVNDSVKKFLQFQVTVNITAVVLTFISAVGSSAETSVLTAVQLLWVNLIMDTFAALALATDPPQRSILNRRPEPKTAPLISMTMWKMIIGQSIYQLVVTLILYFGGTTILSYQTTREQNQLGSLIFNVFVWMQIFNQYNCRRLDNGLNVFEGILRNYFFIGIQIIIIGGQIIIMFKGGAAFNIYTLNGAQWGYSIVLGLLSVPIAIIFRLIPDELFEKLIPSFLTRDRTPSVYISDEEQHYRWNPALEEVKEELLFLRKLRGGRLNAIKYKFQHPREFLPRSRSGSRSRESSIPHTPTGERTSQLGEGSPAPPTPESRSSFARRRGRSRSNSALGAALVMTGIVGGSIGGWSPVEDRESQDRFHNLDSTQGRFELLSKSNASDLEAQDKKFEADPDAKADGADPAESSMTNHAASRIQVPETTPNFGAQLAPPSTRTSLGSPNPSHKPSASA